MRRSEYRVNSTRTVRRSAWSVLRIASSTVARRILSPVDLGIIRRGRVFHLRARKLDAPTTASAASPRRVFRRRAGVSRTALRHGAAIDPQPCGCGGSRPGHARQGAALLGWLYAGHEPEGLAVYDPSQYVAEPAS